MRQFFLLLLLSPAAFGQWIVSDPLNTTVNTAIQAGQAANQVEILQRWTENLRQLGLQLHQLEEAVATQQRIRDVLGDPRLAGAGLDLSKLRLEDLRQTYGETLAAVQKLADSAASLRRTGGGLYPALDDLTALQGGFERRGDRYRRFAAVERQADNLAEVHAATEQRILSLQISLAETLAQLGTAGTAAEVDKLNVKVAAVNGQLALLAGLRRDEADKLAAQQTLNSNQAEKERLDLWEKQLAEEKQSVAALDRWQEGIRLEATNYTRP